jgi:hypothetical protein
MIGIGSTRDRHRLPDAKAMRLPTARFRTILLVASLLAAPACNPAADIEPVPSPLLRFSTLSSDAGWVTAVGEPGSFLAGTGIVLRNEATGAVSKATATADGSFSASLPASRGDRLRLVAEGQDPFTHGVEAPSPDAPSAPGTPASIPGVSGPEDEGRYRVGCGVGCLPGGAGLVVYAAGARGGLLGRTEVDAGGAFALPVRGEPGDAVFLFAARGGAAGPSRLVVLPLGVDRDGDGFDASVDCDDEDGDVRPGAEERCNGRDDDCNGEIDEGCGGPPCRPDGSCPGPLVCEPTLGVCRSPNAIDRDADGVPDGEDVCPNTSDPDQLDQDGDGKGDACDNDADGDRSPSPVDCDDLDPRRGHSFPEVCGDGVDNDCDGQVDEGC